MTLIALGFNRMNTFTLIRAAGAAALLLLLAAAPVSAQTAQPLKVIRYAFLIAETGFDPA